jgi:hypothetical protein
MLKFPPLKSVCSLAVIKLKFYFYHKILHVLLAEQTGGDNIFASNSGGPRFKS